MADLQVGTALSALASAASSSPNGAGSKDPSEVKDQTQEQIAQLKKLAEFMDKLSTLPIDQQVAQLSEIQSKVNSAAEGMIAQTGRSLAKNILPKELGEAAIGHGGVNRKAVQAERAGVTATSGTQASAVQSDGGQTDFARPALNQSIEKLSLLKQEFSGQPGTVEMLDGMLEHLKTLQNKLAGPKWDEAVAEPYPTSHSGTLGPSDSSKAAGSPEKAPDSSDGKLSRRRRDLALAS